MIERTSFVCEGCEYSSETEITEHISSSSFNTPVENEEECKKGKSFICLGCFNNVLILGSESNIICDNCGTVYHSLPAYNKIEIIMGNDVFKNKIMYDI